MSSTATFGASRILREATLFCHASSHRTSSLIIATVRGNRQVQPDARCVLQVDQQMCLDRIRIGPACAVRVCFSFEPGTGCPVGAGDGEMESINKERAHDLYVDRMGMI
jgi:hypothetical protein